jgi:TRAP-type mannitol/chloroaromatic compound transport system substrate-binding protein
VAKNYYYPAWWEGGPQLSLYVGKKAFDALPNDLKAIVEGAAAYAHTEMQAKYDARNPAALRELVKNGTKLFAMPKPIMDAAFKASQGYYAELSKTNPRWQKVYADYEAFRRNSNQWFRFSEARFDSYMQGAKL